jgi:hypothetical protein
MPPPPGNVPTWKIKPPKCPLDSAKRLCYCFEHQSYLSLCRDGLHRHDTRTRALFWCASIVQTLPKAKCGVGVSRRLAKLGSQGNSPVIRKDKPPVTVADSTEHVRRTILS